MYADVPFYVSHALECDLSVFSLSTVTCRLARAFMPVGLQCMTWKERMSPTCTRIGLLIVVTGFSME